MKSIAGQDNMLIEREKCVYLIQNYMLPCLVEILRHPYTLSCDESAIMSTPVLLPFDQLPMTLVSRKYESTLYRQYHWIDCDRLTVMYNAIDELPPDARLGLLQLQDLLFLSDVQPKRYICLYTLRNALICSNSTLDINLHMYTCNASYFTALPNVTNPYLQLISKFGVKSRCQSRQSADIAMKLLINRHQERIYHHGQYTTQHTHICIHSTNDHCVFVCTQG